MNRKKLPNQVALQLRQLARLNGVLTSYLDMNQRRQEAPPESLLAVLRALGVGVERIRDVPAALREARVARAGRMVDAFHVVWRGNPGTIPVQLPDRKSGGSLRCEWQSEDGGVRRIDTRINRLPISRATRADGERFVTYQVPVRSSLSEGYHRLALECGEDRSETQVVCAPEQCYQPPGRTRAWGAFAPLYALHSRHSWGAGDFGDLSEFITWLRAQGGSFVGTLPLLPAFLDRPCEPSPYSPVSRLCWNEFYLDLTQVPELERCPVARKRLQSSAFFTREQRLRASPLVNYAEQMRLKREIVTMLSRAFFSRPSTRRKAFEQFLREHPHVGEYARFRATCEQQRQPWAKWPEPLRRGRLQEGDFRPSLVRYYLYAQWLAHEQLDLLSRQAQTQGVELYLDVPLGSHRDGYDTWRYKELFALEASGGAPPDSVFTQGQDWGFAPIHPQRSREQKHAYLIAVLRHHLKHARMLRFDHVMGLHRLFWVPRGLPARLGAYMSYPAEELYAILSLESHRHRATIIGENLGTVPPAVNRSLNRHGVGGMFVVQYECRPPARSALRPVPANVVASVNTHDMPPFEGYRRGLDIDDRHQLGLIPSRRLRRELQQRRELLDNLTEFLEQRRRLRIDTRDVGGLLRALLAHLAASPARWVQVNLEDLWLETLPQNVPGTSSERVNWRRKTRLSQEQTACDAVVRETLRVVSAARRLRHHRPSFPWLPEPQ
jgi:4-alpha-glucanotransferase